MEKILSIQSTVTLGFVGNSVAGPVITYLGHQPLLVNSVALAAHPGHGLTAGGVTPDNTFDAILGALPQLNSLSHIGTVITGYLGAPSQVKSITQLIMNWAAERSNGYYVLDPVLGDNGRIYVDNKLVTAIRDNLLPLASFITPNQFELGLLAEQPVFDIPSSDIAAKHLLNKYKNLISVVATGINHNDGVVQDRLISRSDIVELIYKKRPVGIAGGGDLLTTIFASWLAAGQSYEDSFIAASKQAHAIIDLSNNNLEINLLKNMGKLTAVPKSKVLPD
ncbi:bifunctional hydroxymethylpyrimidine kinase/phosphomethylpyrimidine kinase [Candidatus Puniceispirillum sp.]|nr:bifunctional hydroxymethylpyrimidine kinase/phosphomethylpyrimidine kinase [Candidatus Puniceispirillum sp.]